MSRLPDSVATAVRRALAQHTGGEAEPLTTHPVGGGSINASVRVEAAGQRWFLKWNADAPPGFFEAEAEGLAALAETGTLRVPEVVARGGGAGPAGNARGGDTAGARGGGPAGAGEGPGTGSDDADTNEEGTPWLLMEWIEPGRRGPGYAVRLAEGLAALHGPRPTDDFGWESDNFIGALPQENAPSPDWGRFWRDRRLAPQAALARERGHFTGSAGRELEKVLETAPEVLADAAGHGPQLLHGDLWSGNVFPDEEGKPVLVDPAVYRGHGEVDLAMSELFGGFPHGFLDAYAACRSLGPAWPDARRPLYQLYYLLVHVNLFGAGYEAGTLRAVRQVLRAL